MTIDSGLTPPTDSLTRATKAPERSVIFRPRAILIALGVLLGVAAVIGFLVLAQGALTLIAISIFIALALDPGVRFFEKKRGQARPLAVASVGSIALILLALLGLVFIPLLVEQVARFVDSVPGMVAAISGGDGPLGFLERDYHVVEHVERSISGLGADLLAGGAEPVLSLLGGVAASLVGAMLIIFLTMFMLLEGPDWRSRLIRLVPAQARPRTRRIAAAVYEAIGGFVTGNLLASFLGGIVATLILLILGVPFALPVGLLVAIVELIPFIGPFIAIALCSLVALAQGPVTAVIVLVALIIYHVIEGNTLRPLIYGRRLELSPLVVLIAILIGSEVAGILGALVALPVAGSIQAVIREVSSDPPEAPATGFT